MEQLTVGGALSFTGSGGVTATGANILTQLLTVDGAGSGLDADLLDGVSSAGFLQDFNFTDDAATAGLSITESETMTFAGDTAGIDTSGASNTLTISFDAAEAEAGLEAVLDLADLGDAYVAAVADGTGVDGTASGVGSTYTPSLDLTEITEGTGIDLLATTISLDLTELNTVVFGSGTFTTMDFDAGVTDPRFTFGSNSLAISSAIVSVDQELNPDADGGADLGTTLLSWDDLFLDTGATINFDAGDVLITHSANDLAFTGVTGDYSFDDSVFVTGTVDASDDLDAGDDVLIADDINFGGGDVLISYAANDLDFSGVTGDYSFDDSVFVTGVVDASTDVDAGGDVIVGDDVLITDDISFGAGDVLISYAANDLDFSGVTGDYSFDDTVLVTGTVDASDDVDAADDVLIGDDIDFGAGDVQIAYSANDLAFTGVTGDYSFDDTVGVTGSVTASVDVTATAGDVTSGDDVISGDDVLLSDAGVINFNAGDCTLTEGTDTLTIAGTCTLTTEAVVPDGDNTRALGSGAATWSQIDVTTIELANGTANTLTAAAGVLSIEGVAIIANDAAGETAVETFIDTLDNLTNIGAADSPTKGDLIVGDGSAWDDLAVGVDGLCLVADAAETLGVKWDSCAAGSGDNLGDDADRGDITVSGGAGVVADVDDDITVAQTDAGATGVAWTFHHDSASPADGDLALDFIVKAGADDEEVGRIALEVDDGATTTEDTRWRLFADVAGASFEHMIWVGSNTLIPDTGGFVLGHDAQLGTFSLVGTPEFQMLGTSDADTASGGARFSADTGPARWFLAKSRAASVGTYTIVQDGDYLGEVSFQGADGVDFARGAAFGARVDGTPGSGDMPSRLFFSTTSDAAEIPTERWDINALGHFKPIADASYDIGNTSLGVRDIFVTSDVEFNAGTDTTLTAPSAGELTIEGDAVKHAGRRTVSFSAGSATIIAGATGCSPVANFDSGTNDVILRQCSFSASVEQYAYFYFAFPKGAAETTDLAARVSWTSATGTDTSDDVIWGAAAVCFSNDDSINANAFPAADTATDVQTAAGDFLTAPEITAITPAGTPAEGDECVIRIMRDADAAGDTFNGTAELLNVQVYFVDSASTDE